MKIRRQKHVRRVLTFYKNNFGYQPPYHLLLDGTFCRYALQFQLNLSEQMPKYLNAEVKFYTTRCVKEECKALGSLLFGPLKILQQFPDIPCGHSTVKGASDCLLEVAKLHQHSDKKLFIATQDSVLSDRIRESPGIPLIYISHNAINIESPSAVNQQVSDDIESTKLVPSALEAKRLNIMKDTALGTTVADAAAKSRKRKHKGGPNPLSCKKKKSKPAESVAPAAGTAKRHRRKRHKKSGSTSLASANAVNAV